MSTNHDHPASKGHGDTLEEQTGGLKGQTGYNSQFEQGKYDNDHVADSGGTVDDRAGSYEDGYAAPERSDAINAAPPIPPQSPNIHDTSNNYDDAQVGMTPADDVEEE